MREVDDSATVEVKVRKAKGGGNAIGEKSQDREGAREDKRERGDRRYENARKMELETEAS
jgi:hypothetical protein